MRRLRHHGTLVLLTTILALSSLSLAASAAPAALAQPAPTITASGGQQEVEVIGRGFTPGGRVPILVYRPGSPFNLPLAGQFVTASQRLTICSPFIHLCHVLDPGGALDAFVPVRYVGYVNVRALDVGTQTWSNDATTYVRIIS